MDIKVSKVIDGKTYSHTAKYNFGDTIDDMCALFGNDVVFSNARQSMVITLQSRLRAKITEPADVLDGIANEWIPGFTKPKKSKVEKARSIMKDMSKEEIADLLKKYA